MARISRQAKDIIQIVVFLLVVGLLLLTYVIYPLNRTKAIFARPNIDEEGFNNDSLLVNDPTPFVLAGLAPDTVRVESEGEANLACVYVFGRLDSSRITARGTVVVSPHEGETRDSLVWLTRQLADSGWNVLAYDQRASGLSTGEFRGEGMYEAHHVEDILAFIDVRGKIKHPLVVVGYGAGADGVLIASQEDDRIDVVIAIEPYLTTTRMMDIIKERHETYWFPFFRTMMWWWYGIRSGYDGTYRDMETLQPVADTTILFVSPDLAKDEAVVQLINLSDPRLLRAQAMVPTEAELLATINQFGRR